MFRFHLAALAIAVSVGSVAAYAQPLTDEEMLMRFRTQKDIFQSASELGATRSLATRGLSIVSLDGEENTGGEAVTVESTQSVGTGAKTLDPNAPLIAARFEPDISVDIRVEFEFDSAAISRSQQPALDQICRVMTEASDIGLFRIVGHTDGSGSDAYNQGLSTLRAEEVGRHLVDNCGISPSRIEMVGYGERFLANPDDPSAASNRRVEFQALG